MVWKVRFFYRKSFKNVKLTKSFCLYYMGEMLLLPVSSLSWLRPIQLDVEWSRRQNGSNLAVCQLMVKGRKCSNLLSLCFEHNIRSHLLYEWSLIYSRVYVLASPRLSYVFCMFVTLQPFYDISPITFFPLWLNLL